MKYAALAPIALGCFFLACGPIITRSGSGLGSGGTSGAGGASPGTTTASSTATTASATGTGTTTASTTTTTGGASSGSSGGMCPTSCVDDADCQTCPTRAGSAACCDPATGLCFESAVDVCPAPAWPCEPGNVCAAPSSCTGTPGSCVVSCTCDAGGHFQCTMASPPPLCPAVHPGCGDPCDASTFALTDCKCSPGQGQGTAPCGCDATTSTWTCWDPSQACPPVGAIHDQTSCADYWPGLVCAGDLCSCTFTDCGTLIWSCLGP